MVVTLYLNKKCLSNTKYLCFPAIQNIAKTPETTPSDCNVPTHMQYIATEPPLSKRGFGFNSSQSDDALQNVRAVQPKRLCLFKDHTEQ